MDKPLTIKDWALDDRPREKMMAKGVGALSNVELLAILIRSGTASDTAVDLSQKLLLAANNNLNELGKFELADFTKVKGIGKTKGLTIMAALELGRRRKLADVMDRKQIVSSSDAIAIFQPLLADIPHEEFWVLLLNKANKVIQQIRVSQGGISGTVVDVKIILKSAILASASGIILCHNHPSGNPKPSDEDMRITQKMRQACTLFDVALLDHIIVTDKECTSFADSGIL